MGKKSIEREDIEKAPSIEEDLENNPVGTPVYSSPKINDRDIEDIEEELTRQISGEQNESKELFDNKNIRTRTELSDEEIVYATKLRYMAVKFNLPIYDVILQEFMEMRLSRKRKSRSEYIESMKQKMQNMFGNMGFNNGLNR